MDKRREARRTLNALLHLSGPEVLAWLDMLAAGTISEPAEFNWLGLAEAAGANANGASACDESLAWAYIAERAYRWWTKDDRSGSKHASAVVCAMNLRANMIIRFGPARDEPMLDLGHLDELFYHNLPFSYEEACQKAAAGAACPVDEIRKLRLIKNMLSPIARLVAHGDIRDDSDLGRWMRLHRNLP